MITLEGAPLLRVGGGEGLNLGWGYVALGKV